MTAIEQCIAILEARLSGTTDQLSKAHLVGCVQAIKELDDGRVTVPEQPSLEMIQAGWQQLRRARFPRLGPGPGLIEAYKAMVAKAQEER